MDLSRLCCVSTLAAAALLVSPAGAVSIDFEGQPNGEAGPFGYVFGAITVTADATAPPRDHLGLAIFDSNPAGPNAGSLDDDLLTGDGSGPDNILIVQNNDFPAQTGGAFDTPNDDEDGGLIEFTFSSAVTLLSIELIDIDGGGMTTITLFDSGNDTRTYLVPDDWTGDITQTGPGLDTLDLTDTNPQAGDGPGNPLATASDTAGFDPTDVTSMTVFFNGSAGLDNVSFVPEPSTGLLAALGLLGLAAGRMSR